MGNKGSLELQSQADLFSKLGSSLSIEEENPYWKQLLSRCITLSSISPADVQACAGQALTQLVSHNITTRNCQVLVSILNSLLSTYIQSTIGQDDVNAHIKNVASTSSALPTSEACRQLASALHIMRLVVITATRISTETLLALFRMSTTRGSVHPPKDVSGQEDLASMLIKNLLDVIVVTSSNSQESYLVLFEALMLAVALNSSVMRQQQSTCCIPGRLPILDILYRQDYHMAANVLQKLLEVYIAQPSFTSQYKLWQSPQLLTNWVPETSLSWASKAAASLLWHPFQILGTSPSSSSACSSISTLSSSTSSTSTTRSHGPAEPRLWGLPPRAGPSQVSDAALHLLLLLLFRADNPPSMVNPFRVALAALSDTAPGGRVDDGLARGSWYTHGKRHGSASYHSVDGNSSESKGTEEKAKHTIKARALYDFIACKGLDLDPELAVVLLYRLMYSCPAFRDCVLSRTDMDTLLLPLLRLLYTCPAHASNHAYMLQVVLLIFSQDVPLMLAVHHVLLEPSQVTSWYRELMPSSKELRDNKISLGSLMLAVLVRTVLQGFGSSSQRGSRSSEDTPLVPNTALAAIANIAPCMVNIHRHAAMRLVSMFHALSKRHQKLVDRQRQLLVSSHAVAGREEVMAADCEDALALLVKTADNMAIDGADTSSKIKGSGHSALISTDTMHPVRPSSSRTADEKDFSSQLYLVKDCLRIALEAIVNMLVSSTWGSHRNPDLIYALLQKQDAFAPGSAAAMAFAPQDVEAVGTCSSHQSSSAGRKGSIAAAGGLGGPAFGLCLLTVVQEAVSFFGRRLEEAMEEEAGTTSWAVPKIMKLVKSASLFWRAPIGRILDGAAERRFEYEEEVGSEDFFVPYIWGLLLPRLPVCWELDTAEERNEKPVHMSRHCT